MPTENRRRRWFQISLRTLFLLIAVLAIGPGGWISYEKRKAGEQNEMVEKLNRMKAEIYRRPRPIKSLLIGESAVSVVGLGLRFRTDLTDELMLSPVAKLRDLVWLDLNNSKVSDSGLVHLAYLPALKRLRLDETQVTDAGIAHLADLKSLEILNLSRTRIGDAAMKHIARMKNLRELNISQTQVTDEGLKHLEKMPNLERVNSMRTSVGPEAIVRLWDALPKLDPRIRRGG